MSADFWIILVIAVGAVAHSWWQRIKHAERRRFSRTRGDYGRSL